MQELHWNLILYIAGLLAFATSYLAFSPVTRDLVVFLSREAQIRIFENRKILWAVGTLCWGLLLVRLLMEMGNAWFIALTLITMGVFSLAFWATYVPVVMAPPKRQRVVSVAEAAKLLDPEETVLGLVLGDQVRAYPRRLIARPHWFNDRLEDKPVMVSYCILCNSAQAFVPIINGNELDLRNMTAYDNNTVYHDTQTGNYIQQIEGKVIWGPDAGAALESYPVVLSTWKSWKALHPETTVLYAPPLTLRDRVTQFMLDTMIPLEKLARRSRPWHLVRGTVDSRLPAMSFVFGIRVGGEAAAYRLEDARKERVINDIVGDESIVLLCNTDLDIGQIFRRTINGRRLSFSPTDEAQSGVARDLETASVWDASGYALDGPLKGVRLETLPHYNKLFWFSWAIFNPGTRIYRHTDREPIEQAVPSPAEENRG